MLEKITPENSLRFSIAIVMAIICFRAKIVSLSEESLKQEIEAMLGIIKIKENEKKRLCRVAYIASSIFTLENNRKQAIDYLMDLRFLDNYSHSRRIENRKTKIQQ